MSQAAVYDVLFFSMLLFANLPFLSERFLGLLRIKSPQKPLLVRLFEFLLIYVFLLLATWVLEAQFGSLTVRTWTFYVLIGIGFFILSFPGVVYCFFWKKS